MAYDSTPNSTAPAKAGTTRFEEGELDVIVQALVSRLGQSRPAGFQYNSFLLGALITLLVGYFFYHRMNRRAALRHKERDAVEVLKHMDDEQIKHVLGEGNLPSWLNFPDFERVDWINSTLAQLWPYIDSAVSLQLSQIVSDQLKKNKPAWIGKLKLYRFQLGNAPPQVNGVKVYDNHGGATDSISMEFDFTWVGNQDVQLIIKPIPKHMGPFSPFSQVIRKFVTLRAGVERMIVNGRVRLEWKPLLDELPIIGGLQVALVEMPRFSFDVTVYGGDASMVPGLEQWLTTFFKDTIFRPYILPERYRLSFMDNEDMEELKPKGLLFVRVIEAVNVPRMDLFSDSDVYVKLSVRHGIEMKTQIKEDSKHPVWNEDFRLIIHDPEHQELRCVLMDHDSFNADDEIGRVAVPVNDLPHGEAQDLWLNVELQEQPKEKDQGEKDSEQGANVHNKGRGITAAVVGAEQVVSHAIESISNKVPGINKDKDCRLHLEVAFYPFDDEDLEAAAGDPSTPQTQNAGAAPQQNRDAGEHDAAAEPQRRGGNVGEEERAEIRQQQRQNLEDAHQTDQAERERRDQDAEEHSRGDRARQGEGQQEGHRAGEGQHEDGQAHVGEAQTSGEANGGNNHQHHGETLADNDLRAMALDALKGGFLVVRPKRAHDLDQNSRLLKLGPKPSCVVEMWVGEQHKETKAAKDENPSFDDSLEFLVGGKEVERADDERIRIEIWDRKLQKLHIGRTKGKFRGRCSVPLAEAIRERHLQRTLRLQGVKQGELSFEMHWFPANERANQRKGTFKPNT